MLRLVVLDDDPGTAAALEARAESWGVTVVIAPPQGGLTGLLDRPDEVIAVVVGAVPDPIRTAQGSRRAAPDVPVVLVGTAEECRVLTDALRFTAYVGTDVQCVPREPSEALVERMAVVIDRGRRRRKMQRTLGALNHRLLEPTPVPPADPSRLFGRLLEVVPIGVLLVDDATAVRAVNVTGASLLGGDERARLGRPLEALFEEAAREPLRELVRQMRESPHSQPGCSLQHHGRSLEVTGAFVDAASGGPGFLIVLSDVTERHALIEQLQDAVRKKDEFLAMLGHELRNPLAPIRTALALMARKGVDPATAREREIIGRQVAHLAQLIDDLLDVARITRGQLRLQPTFVPIAEVIDDAVEMAAPLLEERRHTLTVTVPQQDLAVYGDRRRLAQVFANLLTNAAKYTDPGGQVIVEAERVDDEVHVAVADTGPGIDPELLPTIFDLFVQGAQGIERPSGGLGLGLAIVRSLVDQHGGRVGVAPADGGGSRFLVSLPLAPAQPAAEAPSPGAEEDSPGGRVLVVDDNEDAAQVLSDLLELCGFATAVAHDGPSALAIAASFQPDVALLDIGLPVMDGYELGQRLRAAPETAAVCLVAVTGYGSDADRAHSAEAGFDAHLVKPLEMDLLLDTLRGLLGAPS